MTKIPGPVTVISCMSTSQPTTPSLKSLSHKHKMLLFIPSGSRIFTREARVHYVDSCSFYGYTFLVSKNIRSMSSYIHETLLLWTFTLSFLSPSLLHLLAVSCNFLQSSWQFLFCCPKRLKHSDAKSVVNCSSQKACSGSSRLYKFLFLAFLFLESDISCVSSSSSSWRQIPLFASSS